jgi:hypothetical protein
MKLNIEVKDNNAAFLMELLKSFSFVKAHPITDEKANLIKEIKEAVDNVRLLKEGRSILN